MARGGYSVHRAGVKKSRWGLELPESLLCFSLCVSAACYFFISKKSLSCIAERKGKPYVEFRDFWKPVYVALNLKWMSDPSWVCREAAEMSELG